MTLPKDCKCGCHAAPHAVFHVHPCCGPGSEGWPHEVVLPSERDQYKIVTLFGDKKPADAAPSDKSGVGKSQPKTSPITKMSE